ncbi:MAG: S24 family peptidase [Alsobacter sp.]
MPKRPSPRQVAFSRFLKSVGDRPADAARRANVSPTTIYSFINRDSASMKGAIEAKIAEAYGLSVEEIFGGELPAALPPSPTGPDAILIGKDNYWPVPVYDLRASAGDGAMVVDGAPDTYQVFRDQFLQRVTRARLGDLSVIMVGGDSMAPTLADGDSILVDRSVNRVVRDGVYVLRYDDELLVKRCWRNLETGKVVVSSDNPLYKPFEVSEARSLDVIGRVVWVGGPI